MMQPMTTIRILATVLWWASLSINGWAATGTVQLTLLGDMRGSSMLFQEWNEALGKAGIRNVRLQASSDIGEPKIDVQGSADHPIYDVTGIIKSREELILPGARFQRSEMGKLAQWLNDLAEQGPVGQREAKGSLGLTESQLERCRGLLAARVGFATQGMAGDKTAEKIAQTITPPVPLNAKVLRILSEITVEEELSEISCGTALAYLLKSTGYGLMPKAAAGDVSFQLVEIRGKGESWPIGTSAEKMGNKAAPALFEFHNVNVQNVPVADALKAIGKRLQIPILIDHKSLAKSGVDPAEAKVSFPQARTTYSIALRRLLFQARMKYELRCDDAGAPFLWVTPLKDQ